MNNLTNEYMRKSVFTLCLLLVWSMAVLADNPVESTSTATITFFRTPSSLLPGKFSVSADKKVRFAKGNLQYLASQNLWRIAEHQWDVIGDAAGNSTSENRGSQSYWIDLFGWGTSGWSGGGNASYQPWIIGASNTYGPTLSQMAAEASWGDNSSTEKYDWGTYIFNSSLDEGYRVLTHNEWAYIFGVLLVEGNYTGRTNAAQLYGMGSLYGRNGLFLLPDNWNWSNVSAQTTAVGFTWTPSSTATNFDNNAIPDTDSGKELWEAMEALGAVFLPCCGYRTTHSASISNPNSSFHYWSSTAYNANEAYCVRYNSNSWTPDVSRERSFGFAVRLVQDFGE